MAIFLRALDLFPVLVMSLHVIGHVELSLEPAPANVAGVDFIPWVAAQLLWRRRYFLRGLFLFLLFNMIWFGRVLVSFALFQRLLHNVRTVFRFLRMVLRGGGGNSAEAVLNHPLPFARRLFKVTAEWIRSRFNRAKCFLRTLLPIPRQIWSCVVRTGKQTKKKQLVKSFGYFANKTMSSMVVIFWDYIS